MTVTRSPHVLLMGMAALALLPFLFWSRPVTGRMDELIPVLNPAEGRYDEDISLQIQVGDPNARILYTLDGSVPTLETGSLYHGPITLKASTPAITTVRARAWIPDLCEHENGDSNEPCTELSPISGASYQVGLQTHLPVISLIADPQDLEDSGTGIFALPLNRGREWERPVTVSILNAQGAVISVPAGMRIHGGTSRSYGKLSLRLYFREEYGKSRLEYPLFDEPDLFSTPPNGQNLFLQTRFKRLVLHAGGQDFSSRKHGENWTLIRNQLLYRLAKETEAYAVTSRPVLLFVNGEPEGIYQLKNYIDDDFFEETLDLEEVDILDARYHELLEDPNPETAPAEIDLWDDDDTINQDWLSVLGFLQTADLTVPFNYAYLESQIDLDNLIDYLILQIYAANTDWPHANVKQFQPTVHGGQWHWILWDADFCFGLSPWGDWNTDMLERFADPDTRPWIPIIKLLNTPQFRDAFLARAADLLNTVLAPDHVIAQIDSLSATLRPDIQLEQALWSSPGDWETSINEMRVFAQQRPQVLRTQLVDHLNLAGTAEIRLNGPTMGKGDLFVNGNRLSSKAWHGIFFRGLPITVTAVPQSGYRFTGWEESDLPVEPEITLVVDKARSITPQFAPIGAAPTADDPQPGDVIIRSIHLDDEAAGGDWFELLVTKREGIDLGGWRVTDNDTRIATDEGSLIFSSCGSLADLDEGTLIIVVVGTGPTKDGRFPEDEVDFRERRILLYAGNENLDTTTDPWFNLEPGDNLVLLAPGQTNSLEDDRGIAFATIQSTGQPAVTPATFGILADGVTADNSEKQTAQ